MPAGKHPDCTHLHIAVRMRTRRPRVHSDLAKHGKNEKGIMQKRLRILRKRAARLRRQKLIHSNLDGIIFMICINGLERIDDLAARYSCNFK